MGDAEDHRLGRAVLVAVAVDFEPHLEVLRVGDFVAGDQPGADRAEGVGRLALGPLAAALGLEVALAEVVDDAIAGDMVEGVLLVDVAGFLADDDAELDFPVGLEGVLGQDDIVVGADDGAGRLHEQDRLVRDRGAGFGGVVGVVEADADELADIADAGADARAAVEHRQVAEIGGARSWRGRRR